MLIYLIERFCQKFLPTVVRPEINFRMVFFSTFLMKSASFFLSMNFYWISRELTTIPEMKIIIKITIINSINFILFFIDWLIPRKKSQKYSIVFFPTSRQQSTQYYNTQCNIKNLAPRGIQSFVRFTLR